MFVSKLSPTRTILYKHLLNNQSAMRNSTISTIASYIKDKGNEIPLSSFVLKKEEFNRYELFRNIKLGNCKWLDNHITQNPLKEEEKSTVVSYINELKQQPYSIPNCFLGYFYTKIGFSAIVYSVPMIFPAAISVMGGNLNVLSGTIFTGSTLALIGMNVVGIYGIIYGAGLVITEIKSPYYDYNEMLKICNKEN
jgi:hypothetical protein